MTIPATQSAIAIVAPDVLKLVHDKPVDDVGPTQLLLQVEACGICFSDTKLLHAFDRHPRKSEALAGLPPDELRAIGSYRPGPSATVPGHEPVARVVRVGAEVTRFHVGARVLVQADWRHLPTAASNSAFGYNFEGALQQYVLVDERIVAPPGGDVLLLDVSEGPSAAAVGLVEPWSTVEASYATVERTTLKPGGTVLLVVDEGVRPVGVGPLLAGLSVPVTVVGALADPIPGSVRMGSLDLLGDATYDDIIYAGSDAGTVERLAGMLALGGLLNVVLAGGKLSRRVALDVGRVHYDRIRFVGTTGASALDAYDSIPASSELRAGDDVLIVGAAGPMGLMHTLRTIVRGLPDVRVTAADVDDARLGHLSAVVEPEATRCDVPVSVVNSTTSDLGQDYTYVTCLVPSPALLADVIERAGAGAIVNAFAGFPAGTVAELDLQSMIERRVYVLGSSGSDTASMRTVLDRLERGVLDTSVSLDAITGLGGVAEAIEAVATRRSGGKIMVYPQLRDLPLLRVSELPTVLPEVAAAMRDGRWCAEAEAVLLARFGGRGAVR